MKPIGPHRRYKSPVAIMKAAKRLLEKDGRWTQRAFMRGPDGRTREKLHRVIQGSENGCSFCTAGAILANAADESSAHAALEAVRAQLAPGGIAVWNDNPKRTQKDVVALLDRAIKAEEKR